MKKIQKSIVQIATKKMFLEKLHLLFINVYMFILCLYFEGVLFIKEKISIFIEALKWQHYCIWRESDDLLHYTTY